MISVKKVLINALGSPPKTHPHTHYFLSIMYTRQLFLSRMHVIFVSILPEFPKNFRQLPNIAEDVPTTSEHCRRFPKMFRCFPKAAECRGAKLKIFARSCQIHLSQTRHLVPFIGLFWVEIESNFSR